MSKELVSHTLQDLSETLKNVCKLEIRLSKTVSQTSRTLRRRKEIIHHIDLINSYEYSFDNVKIENDKIVAKGREIILYDIKEWFRAESIVLFTLNDDKKYTSVYTKYLDCNFPTGGSFTFSGSLEIKVSSVWLTNSNTR